jgi:putative methionine-R-sulfoxide reductase with GAF domain
VSDRPRILVLGEAGAAAAEWLRRWPEAETVSVDTLAAALERLDKERFEAVLSSASNPALLESARRLVLAQRILAAVPEGVALVDFDLKIRWSNPTFQSWCGGEVIGRGFYEALGSPELLGPEYCPFHTALAVRAAQRESGAAPPSPGACLVCRDNRFIELNVTALEPPGASGPMLLVLAREVTHTVEQRQKLDALHEAGRALAALAPEQLAEMNAPERIELLKENIRRFTRDLLHYNVIEIRVLDRQTGKLVLLIQEGMAPEAADRELIPATEGNGVTGYVAAVGKGYLCTDVHLDPIYLPGAPGARSSLTVPLIYQDQVIGTFNVESTEPNHFTEDDLQFAEIFSHDIAAALHTLDLLSAEKSSTATQSIEAVNRGGSAGGRDSGRRGVGAGALYRPRAGDRRQAAEDSGRRPVDQAEHP